MNASAILSASELRSRLRVPVVAAPMFMISSPSLVIAACRAGVVGAFPTINARTSRDLDLWLSQISGALLSDAAAQRPSAPYAANILMHESNPRLATDLELVCEYQVPVVIASVGSPRRALDSVHGYGGLVFADVASLRHAEQAAALGVDGLVLLCAGAGGQTGRLNPIAFIQAVRRIYGGTILVAGGVTHGHQVVALETLGADLAYCGTAFISASESFASAEYRRALANATIDDVWDTDAVSGIPANLLLPSLRSLGLTPAARWVGRNQAFDVANIRWQPDRFSAGHGVGAVAHGLACAQIVAQLAQEYADCRLKLKMGV